MSTPQPSFFRYLVFCLVLNKHRAVFCDCCGHSQCLDCCEPLSDEGVQA